MGLVTWMIPSFDMNKAAWCPDSHGEAYMIPSLDMERVPWSHHWHGDRYLIPSLTWRSLPDPIIRHGEDYLISSLPGRKLPDPLIDKERVTWSPHRHGEGKKQLMEPDCSLHILVKHSEQVITHNLRVTSTIMIIFRLWISWHQN